MANVHHPHAPDPAPSPPAPTRRRARGWIGSTILLLAILGIAAALAAWKRSSLAASAAAASMQPEPTESVAVAVATEREHRRTTTAIGTVLALQSISLRNEIAGTVSRVNLDPGQVVDEGTVLVAMDVSVEEAELAAQQATAKLAGTVLARMMKMGSSVAASETEVDRARAERDVALAQVARIKAIMARKTIRAPFRARIGIADVHPGQYLEEGSRLTTLQGVDDAVHVDFTVAQRVAGGLREGDAVEVFASGDTKPLEGRIVAVDARVDPATRNAAVRAKVAAAGAPAPGSSVRVNVPVGAAGKAVAVPVTALRKGPGGDHVFVLAPDAEGKPRAHERPVESGMMLGNDVLIYAGLLPGERVAAAGSFKLREGVLVAIAPAPAAGAPDTAPATAPSAK